MNPPGNLDETVGGASIREAELELAKMVLAERIRRDREYRSAPAIVGRALYGAWRSIVTGGWE